MTITDYLEHVADADLDDRIWLRQWTERRGLAGVECPDEPEP
ncbi:hypothetical protein [Nocardia sp. BMG111209]|nr:hypothetical protein [Nocardia sp. BMG111209]